MYEWMTLSTGSGISAVFLSKCVKSGHRHYGQQNVVFYHDESDLYEKTSSVFSHCSLNARYCLKDNENSSLLMDDQSCEKVQTVLAAM